MNGTVEKTIKQNKLYTQKWEKVSREKTDERDPKVLHLPS